MPNLLVQCAINVGWKRIIYQLVLCTIPYILVFIQHLHTKNSIDDVQGFFRQNSNDHHNCSYYFFAIIIGGQCVNIKDAGRAIPFFTTTACILIYFFPFAFRPIRYIITADELIFQRLNKCSYQARTY